MSWWHLGCFQFLAVTNNSHRSFVWAYIFISFGLLLLFSHSVWLFVIPWTAERQASLSFTISWSSLILMSIESGMPSNHLILCCPLLVLPSIFPSIRVFSNESVLCIRWPKGWSFSFSISPSDEYLGLITLLWVILAAFRKSIIHTCMGLFPDFHVYSIGLFICLCGNNTLFWLP